MGKEVKLKWRHTCMKAKWLVGKKDVLIRLVKTKVIYVLGWPTRLLYCSCAKIITHPCYISPIEIRSLWTEIKYIKSAARLLDIVWVNKGGLDLSKEVLWVSVGQRAPELQAVKLGGQQKILPIGPARSKRVRTGLLGRSFCWPPTLTACSSDALWPP